MTNEAFDPNMGLKIHLRFSLNQRIQHILLFSLLILLAVTGLALMYHDTWFGSIIIKLEGGVEARGYIHRVAAIALLILSMYHVCYVIFKKEGHQEMMLMKVTRKDFKDFFSQLSFNLRISEKAPLYDKYGYKEKFQYWGVVLGIILMTISGFILWFENQSLSLFPKWIMDLTFIIHGYQGLLLFLILFVWHIFNVHFSQTAFRINKIWMTGIISAEDMKKNHTLEYERLKNADRETLEQD
jgi:cytochrome b subunit of formate dehydrogenase